jgi:hypothetical protein
MRFERAIREVTSARTKVSRLSGGAYYVSVWYDDDSTYNHIRIRGEAYKVLSELKSRGFIHAEFAGRKDMGHSGKSCGFAVRKAAKAAG